MDKELEFDFKESLCDSCRYCHYLPPVEQDPFHSTWCAANKFDLCQSKNKKEASDNIPFKTECDSYLSENVEVKNGIPINKD